MLKIGLTGSIGSGKSTVSAILRNLGVRVLDADQYAREGAVELSGEICAVFPSACVDGKVDRRELAKIVFDDLGALSTLEQILHPYVRARFLDDIEKYAEDYVLILDIPLLYEKGWEADLDGVLVVAAEEHLRQRRVEIRSEMSAEDFLKRDKAQTSQGEKVKKSTWVIWNNTSVEALEQTVTNWYKTLTLS